MTDSPPTSHIKADRRFALSAQSTDSRNRHRRRARKGKGWVERPYVLLATDMLSRGMDIEGLTHVINLRPPPDDVSYLHRAGRVGRVRPRLMDPATTAAAAEGGAEDEDECGMDSYVGEAVVDEAGDAGDAGEAGEAGEVGQSRVGSAAEGGRVGRAEEDDAEEAGEAEEAWEAEHRHHAAEFERRKAEAQRVISAGSVLTIVRDEEEETRVAEMAAKAGVETLAPFSWRKKAKGGRKKRTKKKKAVKEEGQGEGEGVGGNDVVVSLGEAGAVAAAT